MNKFLEKVALKAYQTATIGAGVGALIPHVLSSSHKNHVLNKVQYSHHGRPSKVTDKDVSNVKITSSIGTAGLGAAAASSIKPARDYLQGEKSVLNIKNKYLRAAALGLGVAGGAKVLQHEQLSRIADRTNKKDQD